MWFDSGAHSFFQLWFNLSVFGIFSKKRALKKKISKQTHTKQIENCCKRLSHVFKMLSKWNQKDNMLVLGARSGKT